MEKLDIFEGLHFEEAITKEEFHTYYPRVSNFKLNDEIRITVQNQDTYTLTSDSFIYIEGTFEPGTTGTGTCKLTNNAYAFLFEQIRYEINGVEVDRCTKPGITSALKAYYYNRNSQPLLNYEKFGQCALYVIDCAKQKDAVKTSIVDIKLELESLQAFDEDTVAYCLIIHDNIVEYEPLTGIVKKIV
ncbi:hypothetical protein QE152_g22066 [Popillia japonica]|uniref:Double jelly roll-like domain-containing protein n=1 Tax=Popillia japonica TaxID=7064 RepID=A0AAW1KN97_POPJA